MDSNMNEKTLPGGETLVKAGLLEIIAHYIETLNITHSWYNVFAYALKPIATLITYYRKYRTYHLSHIKSIKSSLIAYCTSSNKYHVTQQNAEAVRANKADFIYRKRIIHGENFVCAGGIWMCEFGEIKKNLIQPQARAFKLGSCELDHEHIPRKPDGSILFLLSLSQKGAAGEGSWEAYRAAFEDYITDTKESKIRMNDTTVEKLYHALGVGYKKNGMQKDGDFFDDDRSGINDFLLRYLHYVLLGIDPFDEEKFAIIRNLHYDSPSAVYYLKVSDHGGRLIVMIFAKYNFSPITRTAFNNLFTTHAIRYGEKFSRTSNFATGPTGSRVLSRFTKNPQRSLYLKKVRRSTKT